jgi:hypothetical protein
MLAVRIIVAVQAMDRRISPPAVSRSNVIFASLRMIFCVTRNGGECYGLRRRSVGMV